MLVDPAIRLPDERCDAALAVARAVVVGDRLDRKPGRDLAGLRAAHAVGDGEERRPHDVGVLVVPALPAGIRDGGVAAQSHHAASYRNSVSPMRTTSPGASRRGASIL